MTDSAKKCKRMTPECENNYNRGYNCNCQKKLEELKDTMQTEMNIVQGQLRIVVDALAEQKVLLKQVLSQDVESRHLHLKFPLQCEEHLVQLNESITSVNRDIYIKAMRSLMQPLGVGKNMKHIISEEITANYNIDGSIPVNDNCKGSAEDQLRKAIQLQKKRHFKKIKSSSANLV